jgi:hypothetical protein
MQHCMLRQNLERTSKKAVYREGAKRAKERHREMIKQ